MLKENLKEIIMIFFLKMMRVHMHPVHTHKTPPAWLSAYLSKIDRDYDFIFFTLQIEVSSNCN